MSFRFRCCCITCLPNFVLLRFLSSCDLSSLLCYLWWESEVYRSAVFKLFWLRTPILLRHSWRTPTLVTVKFTATYSNSWAHCFLQTNEHHQLYTNYNGMQAMLVRWMCLLRFAQTVNWKHVGRKLLKTVQTMTTFRNPLADPLGTRRRPPFVCGPQFENRCTRQRLVVSCATARRCVRVCRVSACIEFSWSRARLRTREMLWRRPSTRSYSITSSLESIRRFHSPPQNRSSAFSTSPASVAAQLHILVTVSLLTELFLCTAI